jgi:hypothetical protein
MATSKYLRLKSDLSGDKEQASTVDTFVGAADAGKVPSLNASGVLDPDLLNAKASSAGAGDASKLVKLDSTGRIDSTQLPVGVTVEALDVTASEALAAGDFTQTYSNAGTLNVRKADASNGRVADSFVLVAVLNGATAKVYFEGVNTGCSSLTLGSKQWLSATTPGKPTATAPSTTGQTLQPLGKATSATSMTFEPGEPITL